MVLLALTHTDRHLGLGAQVWMSLPSKGCLWPCGIVSQLGAGTGSALAEPTWITRVSSPLSSVHHLIVLPLQPSLPSPHFLHSFALLSLLFLSHFHHCFLPFFAPFLLLAPFPLITPAVLLLPNLTTLVDSLPASLFILSSCSPHLFCFCPLHQHSTHAFCTCLLPFCWSHLDPAISISEGHAGCIAGCIALTIPHCQAMSSLPSETPRSPALPQSLMVFWQVTAHTTGTRQK